MLFRSLAPHRVRAFPGAVSKQAGGVRVRIGTFIDRNVRWLFPLPAALFILGMMVFPVVYTIRMGFTGWSLSAGTPATFTGLHNYVQLLTADTRFRDALLRTVYFTALALAVEVVLGVAIALLLNRDFRAKNLVRTVFLLPMMATPVAIGMVWLLMFEPTAGILNYLLKLLHLSPQLWTSSPGTVIPSLVLVDVWEWTPLISLIVLAGLTGLPDEPFEAARVDGATPWQTLWSITLPLIRPTIIVAAMLRAIDAIKTFDIIYTMTQGGPGYSSETLNIYAYAQAFGYYNFGYASALLIVFLAIILAISLLFTRARRRWEA